jgi:hypothetical protein
MTGLSYQRLFSSRKACFELNDSVEFPEEKLLEMKCKIRVFEFFIKNQAESP